MGADLVLCLPGDYPYLQTYAELHLLFKVVFSAQTGALIPC